MYRPYSGQSGFWTVRKLWIPLLSTSLLNNLVRTGAVFPWSALVSLVVWAILLHIYPLPDVGYLCLPELSWILVNLCLFHQISLVVDLAVMVCCLLVKTSILLHPGKPSPTSTWSRIPVDCHLVLGLWLHAVPPVWWLSWVPIAPVWRFSLLSLLLSVATKVLLLCCLSLLPVLL